MSDTRRIALSGPADELREQWAGLAISRIPLELMECPDRRTVLWGFQGPVGSSLRNGAGRSGDEASNDRARIVDGF